MKRILIVLFALIIVGLFSQSTIGEWIEIGDTGAITFGTTSRAYKISWVDAGALRAPGLKPATFVESGICGAWEFSDAGAGNEEAISGVWKIPAEMEKAEGITMKLNWYAAGASAGNSKWQLEYLWVKLNQDETGAAQGTITVLSAASATANGMVNAEFTGIDIPDNDDSGLFFRITRLSADVNDTITAAIWLRGRAIKFISNKFGTAL